MPGIVPSGKLFFPIFLEICSPKNEFAGGNSRHTLLPRVTNHKENNPAHIEPEEQTFGRAE
jgi:hypothetical protein